MSRRATGPSDVQPDPWEPSGKVCAMVQGWVEDATVLLPTPEGESFEECLLCGEVDSHTDNCPVPALKRLLES